MTARETLRAARGESHAGPSFAGSAARDSGTLRRRARFPRCHRVPAVAFSPDWSTLADALFARESAPEAVGVYAFSSGRAGLRFALERLAASEPERRQVVVPAYCCYSVAAAVEYAGLELVVCDIDPATLDYEPSALARAVGARTLCIVLAHLFGCGVDRGKAGAVARRAGCYLVEDAAQDDDPLQTEAVEPSSKSGITLRLISTGRGKPLSTGGGGVVSVYDESLRESFDAAYGAVPQPSGVIDDIAQAARVAAMKILVNPSLFWVPAAVPGFRIGETIYPDAIAPKRMSGFHRRLLARMDEALGHERRTRQDNAGVYAAFLRRHATVTQVRALDRDAFAPHRLPVYLARDRGDLEPVLRRARLGGVSPAYPACLPELPRVRRFCANPEAAIPGAQWTARHLVTLPTHVHVDAKARQRVLNALLELGV